MYEIVLSFLTAFLIAFFAIPSIIKIAREKHIFDEPGERASHTTKVPRLGGIAMFIGCLFSVCFWSPFLDGGQLQYIVSALAVIFLVGARDDILPLTPMQKFAGEFMATAILVLRADVRITSLYGVFGIDELPYLISVGLSTVTIVGIINAVNLIDGINGLSASIGFLACLSFGSWFYVNGNVEEVILASALTGTLAAFLHYNITPARIFMGDTGSLIIGLVCAVLAIRFIEFNRVYHGPTTVQSVPAVAIGILIVPIFDTIRVFSVRIFRGRSPFSPDRNHIHHLLLDLGFSHMQSTGILIGVNMVFIALVYSLQSLGTINLLLLVVALALLLAGWLFRTAKRKREIQQAAMPAEAG
jgi:UDP-N-acetylmuramyl pentapeptide phosphotransferase/UDP-N-acetylglucosamine-1-phosphate transferase